MYFDPYLAQRMAEERIKDRLREAEEARLIRAAKSHKMAWRWWSPVDPQIERAPDYPDRLVLGGAGERNAAHPYPGDRQVGFAQSHCLHLSLLLSISLAIEVFPSFLYGVCQLSS